MWCLPKEMSPSYTIITRCVKVDGWAITSTQIRDVPVVAEDPEYWNVLESKIRLNK